VLYDEKDSAEAHAAALRRTTMRLQRMRKEFYVCAELESTQAANPPQRWPLWLRSLWKEVPSFLGLEKARANPLNGTAAFLLRNLQQEVFADGLVAKTHADAFWRRAILLRGLR